nr:hypothetical protein [Roseovarius sp.]
MDSTSKDVTPTGDVLDERVPRFSIAQNLPKLRNMDSQAGVANVDGGPDSIHQFGGRDDLTVMLEQYEQDIERSGTYAKINPVPSQSAFIWHHFEVGKPNSTDR